MWFMTGWDKVGDYGKKESGRSAKEKPSHKGWAFMRNISLLALLGRLFQPPVVCLQVSKIIVVHNNEMSFLFVQTMDCI